MSDHYFEEDDFEEDDYSDDLGGRSTSKSTASKDKSGDTSSDELAQDETTAVNRLRIVVLLALFLAAVVVSLTVYFITKRGETQQFESEFEGSALTLLNTFDDVVQQKMLAITSFSESITAYAKASDSTWPFVVVPDFAERSESVLQLSGMLSIFVYPIVMAEQAEEWGNFSRNNLDWLYRGRDLQRENGFEMTDYLSEDYQPIVYTNAFAEEPLQFTDGIGSEIFTFNPTFTSTVVDPGPGKLTPLWQLHPVLPVSSVNLNVARFPQFGEAINATVKSGQALLGGFDIAPPTDPTSTADLTGFYFSSVISYQQKKLTPYEGDPFSSTYTPIFDSFDSNSRKMVGLIVTGLKWQSYFENIIPPNTGSMTIVLENTCDGVATYEINGPDVKFTGMGDLHDTKYSDMGQTASFDTLLNSDEHGELRIAINQDWCAYSIRVYPTQNFEDQNSTNAPILITVAVGAIFVFTAFLFFLYDKLVERRQNLVMNTAERSNAIVSSLFPRSVQDRLLGTQGNNRTVNKSFASDKKRVKSFLTGEEEQDDLEHKPIADLFPHTTVLFMDISGFTSWSSSREPGHVFILLQLVYQAFDKIAKKHNVFKVETVGDAYVAVTGIPNPQSKHAVIMARFAWDCLNKFSDMKGELEKKLGPDTSDLGIRIGLHSGPVTAGVLMGERSRFQLFGDTVNTAQRIESTGSVNKIQASQATAQLLTEAGKSHWCTRRAEPVQAKGKGTLETFWIIPKAESKSEENVSNVEQTLVAVDTKEDRLVDWMCQLLLEHLARVVARRQTLGLRSQSGSELIYEPAAGTTCLDEVKKIIRLPKFDAKMAQVEQSIASNDVVISTEVKKQLHDYIATIASIYKRNPFHNFEHAAHVTMAVDKFLKRIVRPDIEIDGDQAAASVHDYTHGINSDPVTLMAIVLSAMIHDSDHRGVSNAQLIVEEPAMGDFYKGKSVAEQNSLDLSWSLLMCPEFSDLRVCMFGNTADMLRFRQIVVNVVLATDIFDKELNNLRKERWNEAFQEGQKCSNFNELRATIVIEHIIQASDVAHTMQHWHVYRKWNERLFTEMYQAFQAGRMAKDPSTFWYQGEIGFFDNYVIPLAKKLKDCQVFGVSSDECLNYALNNKREWEQRGQSVIAEMMEKMSR